MGRDMIIIRPLFNGKTLLKHEKKKNVTNNDTHFLQLS